ncbi:outer membrane beta-barrel protein [Flavihumibacter profundi]|uniref:outer membrane beta-barrel protein n=1 Tax=Flavihumibacter profundi TaxID=2716883 RepID=UPI001CC346D3|nr:outer membrane beta-barrel protein [Flavihumibacter profundi]MBZ5856246.1 TonB-dependent receptor [Flavihumibacter profundi]
MKKTLTILSLVLTQFCLVGHAQTQSGIIQGRVTDASKKPAEAITISLLHAKDSSVAKILATDKSGAYRFNEISNGQYLVMASAVGFQKEYSAPVSLDGEKTEVEIPEIQMSTSSKEMGAVTVTARRPLIEQKMDKMIVNVDAAVTNVGATVLEVLEKSPGVTVDKDGNISLKGKQGVTVMMDGRPTYLTPDQLANLLKSMPASSVDQIEIITNPSAKYDAAGNSGIINIKSKKNKQKGFNGSATANYGQGSYWRTNNSLNLNYRNGKFNVFANGGFSVWNGFQELDIKRQYTDAGSKELTAIFEQNSFMKHENKNYTLKVGADYYLNKKTTLGFVLNGNLSPEQQSGQNTSYLKDNQANIDSIIYSTSYNKDQWKNNSVNLNLRHQYDSTGRELTADIDYVTYGSNSKQNFVNTIYTPDWVEKGQEQLKGVLPVNIDIYSAKADYIQPLKKNAKLETGIKASYVNTENVANYYNVVNGSEQIDYSKTNQFNYKENIVAGYLNYSRKIKKFNVQAGLRYEHTIMEGIQFGNPTQPDSSFNRSYGNLFPTFFLGYSADKNNEFGLSYGKRIDRPAYQDLNPFLFYLDKYTYGRGNPYLRPQYTNNIELSHTFKGILTTTLNYSYTKDYISETFSQGKKENGEEEYAIIVRQGNIGVRQNGGIAVSAQVPVVKGWMATLYANYSYSAFSGDLNGEKIDVAGGNLTMNVNNQFNFGKGWSAELSGWYRTKGVEGQIVINPMGSASAGVSKQVLKGKGTIKMNMRDLFYTEKVKGNINFQTTEAWFHNSRDSRVVNISFVYRFGNPIKGVQPRKSTGGANEEENRVKKGGNN